MPEISWPLTPLSANDEFVKNIHGSGYYIDVYLDGEKQRDVETACIGEGWIIRALRNEKDELYLTDAGDEFATTKAHGRVTLKLIPIS